jgi:signal recognition particle subunit SRP68
MAMKASHLAGTKEISGKTRSHIVSRLDKGARTAEKLAAAISQTAAGKTDVVEAKAYAALIRGAAYFEKQSWEACLKSYSTARIIYSALSASLNEDIFKDLLTETIDPSIRYAAYQLKIPRTQPIPAIARRAFPESDSSLVEAVEKLSPDVLTSEDQGAKQGSSGSESAPKTLTWRAREVKIEDATIAVSWASVGSAKKQLRERLSSLTAASLKDRAAAYDDILIAAQDAVDATKQAIDELKGEGVPQSDPRMQSLQITRTAVNYEMISWRIGRNRILMGEMDGATVDLGSGSRKKSKAVSATTSEEAPGRQLARIKEKVVMYDGTLQSLESIKELPGVAADQGLSAQLDATAQYFTALK